jgi:hypothetical protein
MSEVEDLRRRIVVLHDGEELPPPVFVLAPARSFTSVICAMLGQHPQMYALPETNLLCAETVGVRLQRAAHSTYRKVLHGLLRTVAELFYGAQTEATIRLARQWLGARADLPTELVFQYFMERVEPRIVIEKSPSMTNSPECLRRIHAKFPSARFIHLVRHPRGHGDSVLKEIAANEAHAPLAATNWLLQIATYRPPGENGKRAWSENGVRDPQHWWYARNTAIREFLQTIPVEQQLRVRGEEVLNDPDARLPEIVSWLGLRTDPAAIEAMKHPENSPYAFHGPPGARFGNDRLFLERPVLRPGRAASHNLDGPLEWRDDEQGFAPEVKKLAAEFGYS